MWHYETTLSWQAGKRGVLDSAGKPTVPVGTPVDFGGPEGAWTPEDLLVASVGACLMTTALHFLERAGVNLRSFVIKTDGTLEKTAEGLSLTGITVDVFVIVARDSEMEQAARAIERAENGCFVSRAVKTPVTVTSNVRSANGT